MSGELISRILDYIKTLPAWQQIPQRAVGSTLLIKGLEFNHAILLDADKLDTKNLYVAMTRGTDSLTILSEECKLFPKEKTK